MTRSQSLAWIGLLVLAACDQQPIPVVGFTSTTLDQGLLAHYTFDEDSGTTVHDHSGNGRDGIVTGSTWAWIANGQFGGALHLGGASVTSTSDAQAADGGSTDGGPEDGSASDAQSSDAGAPDGSGGDYVWVDKFPSAPPEFSVSAWVRTAQAPLSDAGGFQPVASTEIVFDAGWELEVDTKTDTALGAHFGFWEGWGETSSGYDSQECLCLPQNQWTHIVAVVDSAGSTLSLYVADQLVEQTSVERAILPGSAILYMGTWTGDFATPSAPRYLVGDIDDVAIYGRALQAAEVQQLGIHSPPDPP
ncbi:MAG: LamG domain-containing protein [Polyangiaceae bacterium]